MSNDKATLVNSSKIEQTTQEILTAINTDGVNKTMLKGYAAMLSQFISMVDAAIMPIENAVKALEGYVTSNRRTRTVSTFDVEKAALQPGINTLKKYVAGQKSLFNGIKDGYYMLSIPLDVCQARGESGGDRVSIGGFSIANKTVPASTGETWVDHTTGSIYESRIAAFHKAGTVKNKSFTGSWPYAVTGYLVSIPNVDLEGKSQVQRKEIAAAIVKAEDAKK